MFGEGILPIVSSAVATKVCETIPQNGLVASYPLRGTAEDVTGNYDGTEVNNSTYIYTDELGIVHTLGYKSVYIELPANILQGNSTGTICFWNYTRSPNDHTYYDIIRFSNTTSNYYFKIRKSSANGIQLLANIGDDNKALLFNEPGLNTWSHLAIVQDGIQLFLYVDGAVVSTTTTTNAITSEWLADLGETDDNRIIKTRDNQLSEYMSNLHLYNRALTESEIQSIYNLEKQRHTTPVDNNMLAYYPLKNNGNDNGVNAYDADELNVVYDSESVFFSVSNDQEFVRFNGSDGLTLNENFTINFFVKNLNTVLNVLLNIPGTYEYSAVELSTAGEILINDYATTITTEPTDIFSNTTNWHMVTISYTNSTVKVYHNAMELTTSGSFWLPTTLVGIGQIHKYPNTANANNFKGYMKEIKVYNRTLEEKEISQLYELEKESPTYCVETTHKTDIFEDESCIFMCKFDSSVVDATGTYAPSNNNVTFTDGVFGESGVFNGTSSTVLINGLVNEINELKELSVSFWFKSTQTSVPTGLVSFRGANSNNVKLIVALNRNSSGDVGIDSASTSNFLILGTYNGGYNDGNWHHVVASINYDTKTYNVYVDNVLRITGTNTSIIDYNTFSIDRCSIGDNYGIQYFNGNIDQLRVFGRVLTQEEVSQLYCELKG